MARAGHFLSEEPKDLRGGAGGVMKWISAIAQAALRPVALDARTMELIALAISVAVRCDDCIALPAKAAVGRSATRDDILEVLDMAIYMGVGGGPRTSAMMRRRLGMSRCGRRARLRSLG